MSARSGRRNKRPCQICGKKTDSQGWCGSRDHDAGNPFSGIDCLTERLSLRDKELSESIKAKG